MGKYIELLTEFNIDAFLHTN